MVGAALQNLLESFSYRSPAGGSHVTKIMKPSQLPRERVRTDVGRALQAATLQIEFRHPTHIGQAYGFTRPRSFVGRGSEKRGNMPAMMLDHRGAAFAMRVE